MSGGVSIRPSEKSLIVYNFALRFPRRTPDIPRRTEPETRRSPLRAQTMAERNKRKDPRLARVPSPHTELTCNPCTPCSCRTPSRPPCPCRKAAAHGCRFRTRLLCCLLWICCFFHSTTPFGGLPRMGFRPSGDSIAPLGSFIHRQTSATPSEHTTSVNGQS